MVATCRQNTDFPKDILRDFPVDEQGHFRDAQAVSAKLKEVRPDLVDPKKRKMILKRYVA
jgi:hypothetical protein